MSGSLICVRKLLNSAKSLKVHLQTHNRQNTYRNQMRDSQSSAECSDAESKVADSHEDWKEREGSDHDGDGDKDETKEGLCSEETKIQTLNNLCWVCGKLLNSTESLKVHLQMHNEETSSKDQIDDKQSLAECSDVESKVADCYKDWKESEGTDSDVGSNEEELKGEPCSQETTTSNEYCCKVCGRYFCTKGWFLRHVRENENDTDLCGVCGRHFENEEGLRLHLQTYIRANYCDVCGKHFDGPKKVEIHMRAHTGEKPYICSVCRKTFARNSSLKDHMRIHTGEKPHVGSVCGQSFISKRFMMAHMRIHTGEKPFLCSVCGKGFREMRCLKMHAMIHTGEKTQRCTICDKKFYHSGALKIHTRSHTGEKPHQCKVCGKRFAAGSSLTKHKAVHGGERTHCCFICRKRFLRKEDLNKHVQTHRN